MSVTFDLNVSRWLEAHCDRNTCLTTLPQGVVLSDISGDGNYQLAVLDLKLSNTITCKLKTFKDTLLVSDQNLPDVASGLISFYTDDLEPRIPVVAVACNNDLLIYKNNKPFYKFSGPTLSVSSLEDEVWKKFYDAPDKIIENLKELNSIPFSSLSYRSQQLLILPTFKADEYIRSYAGVEIIKKSCITAMATLNRNAQDHGAIACPILGTESGHIYVLDPQSFSILHQANVCNIKATPAIIRTVGMYEVEYRIVIACRENIVCLLRKGWVEGKMIVQLNENIVDMIITPGDHFITIATSNKTLHCYTKRGQRLWTNSTINLVTCLCLVLLKHLSTHLVAVGMKGGTIHLYHGRNLVDYTQSPDTPSTIVFGQLGQEEHVMVIVTMAGHLNFKILKRTADFQLGNKNRSVSANLSVKPLPLPKRSKLVVEQSMRERQNPTEMHQIFQQDLIRLRLTAARAYVQALSENTGLGNEQEKIKLSAQVIGLGPVFTLILTLENMSEEKSISGYSVTFHVNPTYYTLSNYIQNVPLIPPGLSYKINTKVTASTDADLIETEEYNFNNKSLKVFIKSKDKIQPILIATINIPPVETSFIA